MNYIVETVGDDELPVGTNAVIVERDGQPPLLLVNGVPGRVWAMMLAYEGAMEPCEVSSVLLRLAV